MTDKYILDGHTPVPCPDLMDWGKWMQDCHDDKRVDQTYIGDPIMVVSISTVFLGLDHSFGGDTPILFETMVFGGPFDQEQERYETWKQAERGHKRWVEKVS